MASQKHTPGWEASLVLGIEALVAGIVFHLWPVWVGGIVLLIVGVALWRRNPSRTERGEDG